MKSKIMSQFKLTIGLNMCTFHRDAAGLSDLIPIIINCNPDYSSISSIFLLQCGPSQFLTSKKKPVSAYLTASPNIFITGFYFAYSHTHAHTLYSHSCTHRHPRTNK